MRGRMKYKNVIDAAHKGYDITIYTHDDDTCTVDLKFPCGELIAGWDGVTNFKIAFDLAKDYANEFGEYKNNHCDDEYCRGGDVFRHDYWLV